MQDEEFDLTAPTFGLQGLQERAAGFIIISKTLARHTPHLLSIMNSRFSALVATLGSLLLIPVAHAQYGIKGDVRNVLDSRRAGGFATVSAGGVVTAITVKPILNTVGACSGGAGYSSAPVVTVGPGSGTTATATAVLTAGVVTSVTIVNGGSGYSASAPPP